MSVITEISRRDLQPRTGRATHNKRRQSVKTGERQQRCGYWWRANQILIPYKWHSEFAMVHLDTAADHT